MYAIVTNLTLCPQQRLLKITVAQTNGANTTNREKSIFGITDTKASKHFCQ
jgi:hypothetical protein